jgi:hypothetical protein
MVLVALVVGGFSIPAAFFPLVGLVLGVAALVLGLLVRRRVRDPRAVIAMGLGAGGVVLSVALFAIFADDILEGERGGDDSEEDEDSEDEDEDEGSEDEDSSSSLLPPYVVAVTLRGARL